MTQFLCEQCEETFPLLEVVAQHGIFFLFGKDDGYYGLVCPDCLHTNLKSANKESLESLKNWIFEEAGKLEGTDYTRLQYNSFPYHTDYLPEISETLIDKQTKTFSGNTGTVTEGEISGLYEDQSKRSRGYCSYHFKDLAIGPSIAVYWFNKEKIKELVKIENRTRLKVFPRYVFHDLLNAAIQNFCWKHHTGSNSIAQLDLSAYPEFELPNKQFSQSIVKNSEFLVILKHMPPDPNGLSISESERATGDSHRFMHMWDKISDGYDRNEIQKILSYYANKFIYQIYRSACRTDFSASDVSDVRNKYLRDLAAKFLNREDQSDEFSELRGALLEFDPSLEDKAFAGLTAHQSRDKGLDIDDKWSSEKDSFEPVSEQEIIPDHQKILEKMRQFERRFSSLKKILTQNDDLMELKYRVAEIAKLDTDVLILGETGTGKELFAKAIHQASSREGNFVPVNCGGIPKDLFESELFGHKKGAYSGAFQDTVGAFEYANKGTLFLDEIGEMPLDLQAKILRAVEYRVINRIGNVKPIYLDIKIVFATNRDLKRDVGEGKFRKDLFFRIFSPGFRIIPLRERIEDIPLLVEHFIALFNEKFGKKVESVSPSLNSRFRNYVWEGNVRELMKVIEMGIINSMGATITEKEIPYFNDLCDTRQDINRDPDIPPATKISDDEINFWMKKLNQNKSQVARRLGVSYRTILRRTKNIYH